MPALAKTDIVGEIVWVGVVPDRDAALASTAAQSLKLDYGGPVGEAHGGLTRPSCSRVLTQYPRGTEIRNTRQLSIISEEELQEIADIMGVDRLEPSWLGATVMVRGIPDFTHIPPSSRLQGAGGATVTVDMENRPCTLPVPVIDAEKPGFGRRFKFAAKDKRGVTAWVERPGTFTVGEAITLHIPQQRAWRGAKVSENTSKTAPAAS